MSSSHVTAAAEQLRAVVVITHPDDELFMSGTLGLLAQSDVSTTLICVTRGESGTAPDCLADMNLELGRIREGELIQAVKVLGVQEVHVLGFPDVHPHRFVPDRDWDFDQLCDCIQTIIAHVRPTMVFSHGPHGGTGHPAHKEVYRATQCVLERTGNPAGHYSFAAMTPAPFYTEFFDDDCEFYVDVRRIAPLRALSFGYHQSQLQAGEFLNPPFPRTPRKVLSALFGYCFWFTESGRARIPTITLAQFFRRYPFEGFVTRRTPQHGHATLRQILNEHCHTEKLHRGRPRQRVERERDLGVAGRL